MNWDIVWEVIAALGIWSLAVGFAKAAVDAWKTRPWRKHHSDDE